MGHPPRLANLAAAAAALALAAAAPAASATPVVSPQFAAWAQAARAGRADMLVLGDSLVNGGNGWDAGFINALSAKYGLAGTGLITDAGLGGYGDGYYLGAVQVNDWDRTRAAVYNNKGNYVPPNPNPAVALTAGPTPINNYFFVLAPTGPLAAAAAYHWDVYTSSAPGGGTITANRSASVNDDNVAVQVLPTVTTTNPATGLRRNVLSYAPVVGHDGAATGGGLSVANTSILYSRVWNPAKAGATVTSWAYGGHSSVDFIHDRYEDGTFDPVGRAAYLNSVVDGGSGKLNVVISEGPNDANHDAVPSYHGILPGNSNAAYADNISSLIALVRQDWANAGRPAADLTFTLLGMVNFGDGPTYQGYSAVLRDLAAHDPALSFVDLDEFAPATFDQAVALGYYPPTDSTHMLKAGSTAFATQVLNALDPSPVPEPTTLTTLAAASLGILARRRGRRASTK